MSRDSAGEIYTSLAAVYDRLNAEVDYAAIADHIERQFGLMTEKPVSLLDLACGTGSLTLELARRGYDLIGVDLSEDMLAEARHRFDSAAKRDFCHDILLIRQNIADLELYGTVDALPQVVLSGNTSVSEFEVSEAGVRVVRMNDLSHLPPNMTRDPHQSDLKK